MGKISILENNRYYKIDDSETIGYISFQTIFEVLEFFTGDCIPVIVGYLLKFEEIGSLNVYSLYADDNFKIKVEPVIYGYYEDDELKTTTQATTNNPLISFIDLMIGEEDEEYDFFNDINFDFQQFCIDECYHYDYCVNVDEFLSLECIKNIGLTKEAYNQTLLELSKISDDYENFVKKQNIAEIQLKYEQEINRLKAELEQAQALLAEKQKNEYAQSVDEPLHPKTKTSHEKLIAVLASMAKLDFDKPFSNYDSLCLKAELLGIDNFLNKDTLAKLLNNAHKHIHNSK